MATLRELRNAKGWSQQELASRAGISLQTVSRIETGKVTPVKAIRAALATALNVSSDEITVEAARKKH